MNQPKYHHYLSQFYLRWFETENKVNWFITKWCYYWDFSKNPNWDIDKRIFWSIKNIWWKNNLFSELNFVNWEKKYDPRLEKEFSNLEWEFSILLNKIKKWYIEFINKRNKNNLYNLTEKDKEIFWELIKFQIFRSNIVSPDIKNYMKKQFNKIINWKDIKENFTIEKINQFLDNNNLKEMVLHNWPNLSRYYFKIRSKITDIIMNRTRYIFYITKKDKWFITSDFPLYRHNSNWNPNWILYSDTELIYTLTPNICLVISWENKINKNIIINDKNIINRVNFMMLGNAKNIVISNNKKLLYRMIKLKKSNSSKIYPANKHF